MRWILTAFLLLSIAVAGNSVEFRPVPLPAARPPYAIAEIIRQAKEASGCALPPKQAIKLAPADQVSKRIKQLFDADQAERSDWQNLNQQQINALVSQDRARRQETLEYILRDQLSTDLDFLGAAFIFQHGNCADSYLLAHQLAGYAIALSEGLVSHGEHRQTARWLYAATFDRYLRSKDKPQRFGTQYMVSICAYLQEFDPSITDEERAQYNVPPIEQAKARIKEFGEPCH